MSDTLTTFTESNNLLVLRSFEGHKQKYGKSAGKERNAYHLVCDKDNAESEKYYIMEYEKKDKNNEYFKFDINSLEKVQKVFEKSNPTWYQSGNGYIATHIIINKKKTCIHLHQYLMDYYGQNSTLLANKCSTNTVKGISIDHINRCRTDNRLSNLRLATQSEQNYNQVRERGTNLTAKKVVNLTANQPVQSVEHKTATINHIKQYIPKYVGYRSAAKESGGGTHGEHFVIEVKKKDPITGKIIRIRKKTTKSSEYSLAWKLILAIKIRYQLVEEYKWVQEFLEISSADELADFADEEKEVIRKLAKLEHLQETAELLDLKDITTAPKYRLERVKCSTCGKEVSKEALSRHNRLKHTS
jgi:hypothetical protein